MKTLVRDKVSNKKRGVQEMKNISIQFDSVKSGIITALDLNRVKAMTTWK